MKKEREVFPKKLCPFIQRPPGDDFLIIGHESFCIVEEVDSKKSCCRIKWKGEYE
ncbi:MAG: hypothetical protein KGJ87_04515 [Planctomycetota bacterium]|nr:hypothetical protein [Planctomycetota bacterium]MDE1889024.1 hypothetical protein [Planctomycetota bacterium]MDE2216410.1 hypothetical protein [Planctomycetota bacterium]